MAVWQYRLNFLPSVEGYDYSIFQDEGGVWSQHDPSELWEKIKVKYTDLHFPKGMPEKGESWDQNTVVLGNKEKYHLNITNLSGFVESIDARLDLRDNILDFLNILLDFANDNNLVILAEDITKLPNDIHAIISHIKKSDNVKMFTRFVGSEGVNVDQSKPREISDWLKNEL